MTSTPTRRVSAFTLIEVMAVVLLTALVLGVALNYYYDLSNASQRAMDRTREVRRATAILDRIASDLQGATLVMKPDGDDPLSHPWIFLGENHGHAARGSDRIKFDTRNYQPKRQDSDRHESDRAIVTYSIDEDAEGTLMLRRGVSTHWPDGRDLEFPQPEQTLLLSDELKTFSLTFLDEAGVWQPDWNSSDLVQSDQLPVAVKIELEFAESLAFSDEHADALTGELGEEDAATFRRTVALTLRPLDLALLTDPEGPWGTAGNEEQIEPVEEGDEEEQHPSMENCPSGRTLRDCFDIEAAKAGGDLGISSIAQFYNKPSVAGSCVDGFRSFLNAFLLPECQ